MQHAQHRLMTVYACTGTSSTCKRGVCVRQPPTLTAAAAYVVFTFVFNLERWQLSPETTYHQYVYAARSGHLTVVKLFPRDTVCPVREWRFGHKGVGLYHQQCAPRGSSVVCYERSYFHNASDSVDAFVRDRQDWLCWYCNRPLFIPASCVLPRFLYT